MGSKLARGPVKGDHRTAGAERARVWATVAGPVAAACSPPPPPSLLAFPRAPTCMVTLAVSTGTQCRFSSPQQPVQRSRETHDGLNMCCTSLGYSATMSTSLSRARQ